MDLQKNVTLGNIVRSAELKPIPAAARSRAWVCGRSLPGIAGSHPAAGLDASLLERCELSGRVSATGPITRSEVSYRLWCVCVWPGKGKGKVPPKTDHEGPEGKYKFSSTLSLTLALDEVGGQRHAPTALPPGKTRYPSYRASGQVWTGAENLAHTGIRSPDCPARSESLYRLRYPGPRVWPGQLKNDEAYAKKKKNLWTKSGQTSQDILEKWRFPNHTTADKVNLVQTLINIDTFLFPIADRIIRTFSHYFIWHI